MSTRPASPRREPAAAALDAAALDLLGRATALEKHAVARLITLVEQEGDAGRARRAALFRHLAAHPAEFTRQGCIIGLTGTPGAGKSSLLGRVALTLLARDPSIRIAILAIDPTSPRSGGALLGDRVRTSFPAGEARIFFRSQASRGDLGGLGRRTFVATRLLAYLFDLVCIETVGIGQSEIEVSHLADQTILVLQPLMGDQVQYMKAGIMEVPDVFVVNKCDEEALARRSLHELTTTLDFARLGSESDHRIVLTSAVTGRGVDELADVLTATARRPRDASRRREREAFFLRKAIGEQYGRFGVEELERFLAAARPGPTDVFEDVERGALDAIAVRIR